MNEQEFERKMAFIVDQQAQFASDIQELKETQVETANVVGRLAYVTLEGFKDVNGKIDALVDSQLRLAESQSRTDENLNVKIDALVDSQLKLTESQSRTTEDLRNLISVVDRHLREDHNGK